ncbi:hypothetical protein PGTUg99_028078 [Puccinia graminis f. sp. tritici]|nr:hypothetical protein PGTUg99_028078 [Puccinia graminis f. sp. tritici]
MQHLSTIMSRGLMAILLLVPAATCPPTEPSSMTCGRCSKLAKEAGKSDPMVPLLIQQAVDTHT